MTLYSGGDSRLLCSLGMQIPSLSFTIENANTFENEASIKHSQYTPLDSVCSGCRCPIRCYFSNFKTRIREGWGDSITALTVFSRSFFTLVLLPTELDRSFVFSSLCLFVCLFSCQVTFVFQKMSICYRWVFGERPKTKQKNR